MSRTLYTYGYGAAGSKQELEKLIAAGATILDVRLRASSRNPLWSKSNLQGRLGDLYVHEPALGNLNYRNGGPIVIADLEKGLKTVESLFDRGPVVLLCACAEGKTCHRMAVAKAVKRQWRDVRICHILSAIGLCILGMP